MWSERFRKKKIWSRIGEQIFNKEVIMYNMRTALLEKKKVYAQIPFQNTTIQGSH